MGRSPCCEKVGLKKGPWTPEEDQKLLAYIDQHGHGSWRALPVKAGLQRCGKSCRLRWTNYLRPDIKRGKFSLQEEQTIIQLHALLGNRSLQEEQTIIQLHALLGNRWSAIATHLPKRTDNEIKNYWNTHLKKRLTKMGIDPVTHKPKTDTLCPVNGQSKDAANLSHMAQWESARLEAEARLVRESKLGSNSIQHQLGSSASAQLLNKIATPWAQPLCFDVLKAWDGIRSKSTKCDGGGGNDLESSSSTLSFSEIGFGENLTATNDFVGNSDICGGSMIKEEGEEDWSGFGKSNHLMEFKRKMEDSVTFTNSLNDVVFPLDDTWTLDLLKSGNGHVPMTKFVEGFTDLLLDDDNSDDRNSSNGGDDSDNGDRTGSDEYGEHKNYWNEILNLVNSSPNSPVV